MWPQLSIQCRTSSFWSRCRPVERRRGMQRFLRGSSLESKLASPCLWSGAPLFSVSPVAASKGEWRRQWNGMRYCS
eukprot:9478133-Pyramimonas_sp.AAC.1